MVLAILVRSLRREAIGSELVVCRTISLSPLDLGPFFVVEEDKYDCAFFDKRLKSVQLLSATLILNNLEFDHAYI
ncbi:MAG: UDP-N-acetylmuramate--L-alanyl-gamma-D-glutamyl-meso-2,6-diaminoheptandioate ligase [Sodalis sp.]|nr:MAG: UDP-N-acetylmuramate--L-alanyl-gamma-D-glutamyl-meso-2,6-diaminoheptandioate ligase [Sodalis sp.]